MTAGRGQARKVHFDMINVMNMIRRVIGEHIGQGIDQLTIYVSKGDKAIGLAQWLFGSLRRLGQVRPTDLSAQDLQTLKRVKNVSFVDREGTRGFIGHAYFHSDPATSSDVILTLRDDYEPGADNGRPLRATGPSFWLIPDDYPRNVGGDRQAIK